MCIVLREPFLILHTGPLIHSVTVDVKIFEKWAAMAATKLIHGDKLFLFYAQLCAHLLV